MNRTGGQLKQPQPELERGKKLQKQEPRRPDKPETQAQATGRNPRTTQSTEEHPRNTSTREATIPTRRQQVNTATDRLARQASRARKRTKSVQASLRVKTDTAGGTERWPQEGGGTTRETVSKSGIDNNPGRATTPKKLARLESNIQTKRKSSLEKARVHEKEPLPTPEGEEKRPINTLVATRHRTEDRQRQPAGKRDSSQPSGRNHAEAP